MFSVPVCLEQAVCRAQARSEVGAGQGRGSVWRGEGWAWRMRQVLKLEA